MEILSEASGFVLVEWQVFQKCCKNLEPAKVFDLFATKPLKNPGPSIVT